MAAVVMAAATIIGSGTPAGLSGLATPDTAITASAASPIFSKSCKMADFMKGTAEDEAAARAVLKDYYAFDDYEALGYSAMCTKGLETNYIILYNGANIDFEAALNTENGQKWAKNYSKLLTTLYQLSGSNRENLIVVFNTDIPSSVPGFSSGPVLSINSHYVFDELCGILSNTFTWCLLHETGHCFSGSGKGLANVMKLYNDYLSKCTETIRYCDASGKIYTVKVTPNVQKWIRKIFKRNDGVYSMPGTVIQTFNGFDFMGKDIETYKIFYRDENYKPLETTPAEFYSSVFFDPGFRAFTLTETHPPITEHPADATVPAGDTVSFSVKTSSDDVTYKWQYNTGKGLKDSTATGAKTAAVSQKIDAKYDGIQYRCKITSANGTAAITEAAAAHVGISITKQQENADCDGTPGITGGDAIAIQKVDAGILVPE